MEVVYFLVPFVLLGVGVIFVAFSGGPGGAREAYLTKGGRFFRFSIVLLYVALGLAVPALVIADREPSEGATPLFIMAFHITYQVRLAPASFGM